MHTARQTVSGLPPVLAALYRRRAQGVKLGLGITRELLDELGRPQEAVAAVHVAGTNGKGSVCAMLESVLRCTGRRVGLYTSPHLLRFHERFRVNGEAIEDEELMALVEAVGKADARVAARPGRRLATFFEYATAIAFEHFRRRGVEVAILETGLGGRLDATNVVRPLAAVITSISLDHTRYLGDTIEEVAGEKAGIIKNGCPVVCGALVPAAREAVERIAREKRAPLIDAEDVVSIHRLTQTWRGQKLKIETTSHSWPPILLPLLGSYQVENCATAVATLQCLEETTTLALDEEAVRKGLEEVAWPARCEVLAESPPVLLDSAHNPGGARELARSLRDLAAGREVGMVLGFSREKDAAGVVRALRPVIGRCWGAVMAHEWGMPEERLRQALSRGGVEAEVGPVGRVLEQARAWLEEDPGGRMLCIAGSLYLAGEVRARVGGGA